MGFIKKILKVVVGGVVILIGIGVLIAAFGGGGSSNKDQGTGTNPPAVTQSAPKLEVTESSIQKDTYSTYIIGTVKNNSSKQYGYVQVEINLYDAAGNQVNSTLANCNNLEPNGSWKFKAVTFDKFSTYKIKDVTGY